MTKRALRLLAVGMLIPGMLFPLSALANTAANTQIENEVTVSFDDTDGNPQDPVTASVTISVNLVAAAPTVTDPADTEVSETGTTDLIYVLSSNANGPDDYELPAQSFVNDNMDGDPTITDPGVFTLGATTLADEAAAGQNQLTVPFDGATGTEGNNEVNGLTEGATVVIGGEVHVIDTIDDAGAATSNLVTITLQDNLATTQAAGTVVGEQLEVTVTVDPNTVTDGSEGSHTVTFTFASQTDGTESTQAGDVVVTVRVTDLEVSKLVRNVDNPNGGGTPVNIDGNDYFPSDVSGDPGDTMEYLIAVENPAGSSEATNIVIEDSVPMFTTYTADSLLLIDATTDPATATFTSVSDDPNAGAGGIDGEDITFYAGAGGDASVPEGGTLQAEESSFAAFQVTID